MMTRQRFRNGKYRLEIRERDHQPDHVHLTGCGLDVVIDLQSLTVTEGVWPVSLKREVMTWIAEHRDELMEEWKKWHP